jgi:hypothetical protein
MQDGHDACEDQKGSDNLPAGYYAPLNDHGRFPSLMASF